MGMFDEVCLSDLKPAVKRLMNEKCKEVGIEEFEIDWAQTKDLDCCLEKYEFKEVPEGIKLIEKECFEPYNFPQCQVISLYDFVLGSEWDVWWKIEVSLKDQLVVGDVRLVEFSHESSAQRLQRDKEFDEAQRLRQIEMQKLPYKCKLVVARLLDHVGRVLLGLGEKLIRSGHQLR